MRVQLHKHKWLIKEIIDAALSRARQMASPYFFAREDMAESVKIDVRAAVKEVLMEYKVKSEINTNDKSMCSALAESIRIDFWPRKHFVRKQLLQLSFWSVPRYEVISCGTFNIYEGNLSAALQAHDLSAEGDDAHVIAEMMRQS